MSLSWGCHRFNETVNLLRVGNVFSRFEFESCRCGNYFTSKSEFDFFVFGVHSHMFHEELVLFFSRVGGWVVVGRAHVPIFAVSRSLLSLRSSPLPFLLSLFSLSPPSLSILDLPLSSSSSSSSLFFSPLFSKSKG